MKNRWSVVCRCVAVLLAAATVSEAQPRRVPDQVKAVTDMLRKLDEPDLANTIESDIRAGRTTLGNTGAANAETGVGGFDRSVLLRPVAGATGLGTGTTDNTMVISNKILNDISTRPGSEKSAARTTNVVGWALTLRHEYVHMGQRDPHPTPEFENPAYRETIKTGVAWYRTTRAELDDALTAAPTRENLERVQEIRTRLDALGDQVNGIFNDMPARLREGNLAPDNWMTLDGGRVRTPADAQNRNWRTIAEDKAKINEATTKFESAVENVNAPRSGTGVAGVGGTAPPPKPKKKSIFDKIGGALEKADKALNDANAKLAARQGQAPAGGGAAGTAAGGAAGAAAGAASAGGPGSTTLTLELPGYWGHLNYTISGAQFETPTGSDRGNVGGRQYTGKFTGNTLTVSGTAVSDNESSGPGSGDYYELVVEVNVGKERGYFGYIAAKGEKLNKPFNIRVPVSPDAKSGTFSISLLEQNRNYGPHGWVVTGTVLR
jgi:hypothetical protein